jgi:hypothetical protein
MLSSGATIKQIAEQRGVSPAGLKQAIKSIYVKTGCNKRTQLMLWARENSLDDPSILEVPARRRIDPKMRGFFSGK